MKYSAESRVFALVLCGVLLPLAGTVDAADAEATVSPRAFWTGSFEMIPAAAFSASGFDPDGHQFWAAGGYYRGTQTSMGCIKAAVNLPQYAKVTHVQATVYDNDDVHDILIHLNRVERTTGAVLTMASIETTVDGDYLQYPLDNTIQEPVIQSPDYSYYVATCLSSADLLLYGVRINYEAALFRDGFESGDTSAWSAASP